MTCLVLCHQNSRDYDQSWYVNWVTFWSMTQVVTCFVYCKKVQIVTLKFWTMPVLMTCFILCLPNSGYYDQSSYAQCVVMTYLVLWLPNSGDYANWGCDSQNSECDKILVVLPIVMIFLVSIASYLNWSANCDSYILDHACCYDLFCIMSPKFWWLWPELICQFGKLWLSNFGPCLFLWLVLYCVSQILVTMTRVHMPSVLLWPIWYCDCQTLVTLPIGVVTLRIQNVTKFW
jgi:hypothetical protein